MQQDNCSITLHPVL